MKPYEIENLPEIPIGQREQIEAEAAEWLGDAVIDEPVDAHRDDKNKGYWVKVWAWLPDVEE